MNPMELMMMIKGGNGKNLVLNILEKESANNPILANVSQLIKENRTNEIENVARNFAKEKGIDYDKEFNNFKKNLGITK